MKWRVLLIEDSPELQQLLPQLLAVNGLFDTVTVSTLTEGKDHLCSKPVDVVLLDLLLPDSPISHDALETMRLLQSCCPSVPVVVMTGDSTVTLEEVLEAGAQEFLAKPIVNRQQLQDALLRAIFRHRVRSQYQPLTQALDSVMDKLEQIKKTE